MVSAASRNVFALFVLVSPVNVSSPVWPEIEREAAEPVVGFVSVPLISPGPMPVILYSDMSGNVVVSDTTSPSASVTDPDADLTVPIVMPVVQGDVPPESVIFPAVVPAHTVCPTVTAPLAAAGDSLPSA